MLYEDILPMLRTKPMPIPPKSKPKPQRPWPEQVGYITATTRPLNCLVFVLPILVVHQIGIIAFGATFPDGSLQINAALGILRGILSLFGSSAPLYLPGLIVVITLLIWHLAKGYAWQVRARTILGMAIESFLFAWPVWVFCNLVISMPSSPAASAVALSASASRAEPMAANAVLMIGAGIYEELLLRLALISLMTFLLSKKCNAASSAQVALIGFENRGLSLSKKERFIPKLNSGRRIRLLCSPLSNQA